MQTYALYDHKINVGLVKQEYISLLFVNFFFGKIFLGIYGTHIRKGISYFQVIVGDLKEE
jgi:hypothetical protein